VNSPATQVERKVAAFLSRPLRLLIGGEWVAAASGEIIPFDDPSSGRVIGAAAAAGATDVDHAVAAARSAFERGPWSTMPAADRTRLMLRLADAIEANADELAYLECVDTGNPLRTVRHVDVAGAAERLRYNAGWPSKIFGDTLLSPPRAGVFACSIREPLGVVGAITPWNAPLFMAVGKIALAVAAGCTVVLKPAELTPASAVRLGELVMQAGFPPGVINIVTGLGPVAGQALVDHPGVDKIAFTGSSVVGRSILAGAARNMKRVTLELGGKSPVIIFPDADLEAAVRAVAMGIVFKTGQFCAAGTRILVHRAVLEPVLGYIAAGRTAGAEVACGGAQIEGDGYFVQPTVLANTSAEMSVMREEIFGPVLCVTSFDDREGLEEVIALANDSDYGLTARVWTRNLATAHHLIRRLRAGSVNINGAGGAGSEGLPFGGVKHSGVGREGGHEGVESYTEIKTVTIGY